MHGRPRAGTAERTRSEIPDVEQDEAIKPEKEQLQIARERQRAIGRELRRMYNDVVNEPVPEDFYELLRKIDGSNAKRKSD